jgi:regulator of sigma D
MLTYLFTDYEKNAVFRETTINEQTKALRNIADALNRRNDLEEKKIQITDKVVQHMHSIDDVLSVHFKA